MKNGYPLTPDLPVQRAILEAKRDQLRNSAFESDLNAVINEVQLPLAIDDREKKELEQGVRRQRTNARQFYASAQACQAIIDALPPPEEDPSAEIPAPELDS